jgi:single-strand DNA-binding protein
MANLNRFTATGNVTRDPETQVTKSGTKMLKFGIAVNERHGEKEHANFFDCVVFGAYADAIAPYLAKGQKVAIDGSLHYSSWVDPGSGYKRSRVEVHVRHIDMLGGKKPEAETPTSQPEPAQAAADVYDEDIPF